jgi:hypothetical protein
MACVIDGIDDRWIREIRQEILNYILSKAEKGRRGGEGDAQNCVSLYTRYSTSFGSRSSRITRSKRVRL